MNFCQTYTLQQITFLQDAMYASVMDHVAVFMQETIVDTEHAQFMRLAMCDVTYAF